LEPGLPEKNRLAISLSWIVNERAAYAFGGLAKKEIPRDRRVLPLANHG